MTNYNSTVGMARRAVPNIRDVWAKRPYRIGFTGRHVLSDGDIAQNFHRYLRSQRARRNMATAALAGLALGLALVWGMWLGWMPLFFN